MCWIGETAIEIIKAAVALQRRDDRVKITITRYPNAECEPGMERFEIDILRPRAEGS